MNKLAFGLLLSVCLIYGAEKKPVTLEAVLNQHRAAMPTPIWSPDGKRFAVVNQDKVKLFDAATGEAGISSASLN